MYTDARPTPASVDRLIWRTVRSIPRGRVCTYGQVADAAGLGRAARRVGRALRNLPPHSDVPWHRVLRAGGTIAFPCGSEAYESQCRRLESEGVELERGRVDLHRYGWRRSLDEVLWKPRGA